MTTNKNVNSPVEPIAGSDSAKAKPTSKPDHAAMDELVRISEEMGLYQNPEPPPAKDVFRRRS